MDCAGARASKKMQVGLREFRLPESDTRIVVFGAHVFKLKYKMRPGPLSLAEKSLCMSGHIRNDIQKATAAILTHALNTRHLTPVKTDNIVIYPGTYHWPVIDTLSFAYNDKPLTAYPEVILLQVHLRKAALAAGNREACCLGKHPRDFPDSEQLPLMTGIPSSDMLSRKSIKLDKSAEVDARNDYESQVPSSSGDAALPTGSRPGGLRIRPSSELIAHHAKEEKKRLHTLSQPIFMKDSGSKSLSLFQKAANVMKSIVTWE